MKQTAKLLKVYERNPVLRGAVVAAGSNYALAPVLAYAKDQANQRAGSYGGLAVDAAAILAGGYLAATGKGMVQYIGLGVGMLGVLGLAGDLQTAFGNPIAEALGVPASKVLPGGNNAV